MACQSVGIMHVREPAKTTTNQKYIDDSLRFVGRMYIFIIIPLSIPTVAILLWYYGMVYEQYIAFEAIRWYMDKTIFQIWLGNVAIESMKDTSK